MPDPDSSRSFLVSAIPILSVADLTAGIAFYRDRLGFEVAWIWGEPAELAGLCRDHVEVHLAARGRSGPDDPGHAYFRMTGIDAYCASLERAGVAIEVPLAPRPYGLKDFALRDPGGNRLSFGEVLAE